jgi:putative ABC transport system permease protein
MFWRRKREQDLDRELQDHLELEAEERGGDRLAARRALGNPALVREDTRAAWGWGGIERAWQDVRYASRTLRNHPGFAAAAILSVALGIGANTAIFSLINALLLRSLPVRNAAELVQVRIAQKGIYGNSFGYPTILALAARTDVFAALGGFTSAAFTGQGSQRIPGAWVTGGFYLALGVEAVAGRLVGPQDDRPGAEPVVVLSYKFWENRFARDYGVIGRTLTIEGVPVRIVGVSARGFDGANVGDSADLTLPLGVMPQLFPERARLLESGSQWLRVLALPAPGLSLAQVNARMAVIWPQMAPVATTPRQSAKQREAVLTSVVDVIPGGAGDSSLRRRFRSPLIVLLALTGLVLLIACANFANLLLVRGSARAREIALRFAIGAGRGRIVRQLLTESLMLAAAGAALGIVLSGIAARTLVTLLSSGRRDPIVLDLHPDSTVLLFTSAVALVTGVLFALAPALRATAAGPGAVLKSNSGITPRAGNRLLAPVVIFQVSVSLVLLSGAGLFVRTLQNLQHIDPGFRHEGVFLVNVDAQRAGFQGPAVTTFYRSLIERFERLPGVRSASASGYTPMSGGIWSDDVSIGQTKGHAHFNSVTPRFFETMGIPLMGGRDFVDQDSATGRHVCIVNQQFVSRYLPDGIAGATLRTPDSTIPLEVIGIVGNTVPTTLRDAPPPAVFVPNFKEGARVGPSSIEVRAGGSLARVSSLLREELRTALPRSAVQTQIIGLTEQVESTLAQERLLAALGSALGALALLLSALGLYGLLAYTVSRATGEIGIRMALGAQQTTVLWMVLRGALRLVGVGVAVGVPAAWAASRLVAFALFGLTPGDPATIMAASLVLAAVAIGAAWVPAHRASRIDPMKALRWE